MKNFTQEDMISFGTFCTMYNSNPDELFKIWNAKNNPKVLRVKDYLKLPDEYFLRVAHHWLTETNNSSLIPECIFKVIRHGKSSNTVKVNMYKHDTELVRFYISYNKFSAVTDIGHLAQIHILRYTKSLITEYLP
jgi:hypothetical protein